MDVSQLVQLVDSHEHLRGIKLSMLLFEHSRVVEQSPEVTSGHVFLSVSCNLWYDRSAPAYHGQIDMVPILERVQKSDEPRRLDCCQDISFDQDMLDFIHLGQSGLTHLLQSTDFPSIDLSSEVNGSIPSLTDLGNDGELVNTKLGPSFSQGCAFSSGIVPVFFGIS